MGFATHLGPWLLGTVKNTTGTTAGTIRNMGATVVTQTGLTTVNDTTATTEFVLPAGAQILEFFVDITTAYAGTTGNTITIQTFSRSAFKMVYKMVSDVITVLTGITALYITTPPCDK